MSGVEIATWVHRKHNIKLGNIGKRGRGRGGEKSIILLHIEFRSWTSDHIFFIESVTSCKTILVGLSPHNGHRRNFLIQWYLARQGLNKVCIPQCIKHTSDVSMHIFHPWNVIQCWISLHPLTYQDMLYQVWPIRYKTWWEDIAWWALQFTNPTLPNPPDAAPTWQIISCRNHWFTMKILIMICGKNLGYFLQCHSYPRGRKHAVIAINNYHAQSHTLCKMTN